MLVEKAEFSFKDVDRLVFNFIGFEFLDIKSFMMIQTQITKFNKLQNKCNKNLNLSRLFH